MDIYVSNFLHIPAVNCIDTSTEELLIAVWPGTKNRFYINNGDNTFVYTSANDGSGANFNAANATSIGTAIDAGLFDRITGFDGLGNVGGDTLEFSNKILPSLDNIATNVQTTDISENVLISGTPGLFMYEVEGKTYLIYDATGDNTVNDDSKILAELDISGVVAVDVNDDFTII